MKGFVFSLALPRTRRQKPDLKRFLHRYGLYALFAGLLLLGLALGAVYARNADKGTLRALDLLFTTNLDARLSQSPVGTFCACFASDFLAGLSTNWQYPKESLSRCSGISRISPQPSV